MQPPPASSLPPPTSGLPPPPSTSTPSPVPGGGQPLSSSGLPPPPNAGQMYNVNPPGTSAASAPAGGYSYPQYSQTGH